MTQQKSLTEKLSEVMAEVGYVQKDGTNTHFKYKYASAEAVLKKVNAALSSRGIALGSRADLVSYEKGHAVVRVELAFMDNEKVVVVQGLGEGSDKGDKAVMKANTAALKYALANAFMISWGDDPEADASTDERAESKSETRRKTSQKAGDKKTAAKSEDPETLSLLIAAAKTIEDLTKNNVKAKIKDLRDTDKSSYDKLRVKYQDKEKELTK